MNDSECENHQGYEGKSTPYVDHCLSCWRVYFSKNSERGITGDVMAEFVRTLELNAEPTTIDIINENNK